jgi:hypothetical protein
MARTYTGKLEDFVRVHARYVSLHAGVTDTFTLATWADMVAECAHALARASTSTSAATREAWADQDAHWRAMASGHRRAHNLFSQVEPGTPLLCEPARRVAVSS